uniref:Uncharacterized protein n=1 Tax=Romanomermis culicivorax TaxID=13658 RepID=A0A915KSW7_ROMCU
MDSENDEDCDCGRKLGHGMHMVWKIAQHGNNVLGQVSPTSPFFTYSFCLRKQNAINAINVAPKNWSIFVRQRRALVKLIHSLALLECHCQREYLSTIVGMLGKSEAVGLEWIRKFLESHPSILSERNNTAHDGVNTSAESENNYLQEAEDATTSTIT